MNAQPIIILPLKLLIATPRPNDPVHPFYSFDERVWYVPTMAKARIRRFLCNERVLLELENGNFQLAHLRDVRKRDAL